MAIYEDGPRCSQSIGLLEGLQRELEQAKEKQLKLEASIRFLTANPDAVHLLEHIR